MHNPSDKVPPELRDEDLGGPDGVCMHSLCHIDKIDSITVYLSMSIELHMCV